MAGSGSSELVRGFWPTSQGTCHNDPVQRERRMCSKEYLVERALLNDFRRSQA